MSVSIRTLCCSMSRPYSLIAVCLGSGASTGVATSAVAISPTLKRPCHSQLLNPLCGPFQIRAAKARACRPALLDLADVAGSIVGGRV